MCEAFFEVSYRSDTNRLRRHCVVCTIMYLTDQQRQTEWGRQDVL